ncbi:hypothetical protein [Jannaschia pohangensis]|uniref:Uncharacterized protein n=1 Tax=Jannaschia pohangensis TaxID=390807 RepID=A0A1I3GT70_9RHOB|nr:hypothetical protein [Jannaschia pohangensis]SFI26589.1 hypothetical protein SAMN04488095_0319 [Jannaschia pohangensis]
MIRTLAALCLLAGPAAAQGFATKDLTRVTVPTDLLAGQANTTRAEPARLTILCTDCGADFVAIDVLLGRQTDGTEARFRSGQTTIAMLEAQCKARAPECTLSPVSVGGAVGWMSSFASGNGAGATAVLLQDGDMLTIRSLAPTADTAVANATAVANRLAPQIVSP